MKQLSKKDIKEINQSLIPYNYSLSPKSGALIDQDIVVVDSIPELLLLDNKYLPTMKSKLCETLPNVYIDFGAIPFILKGADLMRPGIKDIDTFAKNAIVCIRDFQYKKLIGLGIAQFDSSEIKPMQNGKVIKTYTYFDDYVWKYGRK